MTTKEKILHEALTLFSEKGYRTVYVDDIAAAVGIKAPSLYKHYKSKQEIFDSCVEKFYERMTQIRNSLLLPGTSQSNISYKTADLETITESAVGLFMFYWKDDVASKFRKMLTIERYRNPELNKMYEDLFVNGAVEHEEGIFSDCTFVAFETGGHLMAGHKNEVLDVTVGTIYKWEANTIP